MSKTDASLLIKLLKFLRKSHNLPNETAKTRGRPARYSPRSIMAVWLIMTIKQIRSFKGVHKFLKEHPMIRKYCGLERLPDRATLSRRLRAFFNDFLEYQPVYKISSGNFIKEKIL